MNGIERLKQRFGGGRQVVVPPAAVLLAGDEAGVEQFREGVAHGALAQADGLREFAGTDPAVGAREQSEQFVPCVVGRARQEAHVGRESRVGYVVGDRLTAGAGVGWLVRPHR